MKILKKLFGGNSKIHVDEIAVRPDILLGDAVIVDSGENEFGRWIKFGNGLMICHILTSDENVNIVKNGEWKKGFKFPQEFRYVPSTSVFAYPTTSTGAILYIPIIDISASNLFPGSWQIAFKNTTETTVTKILRINLLAIGRWK